MKKIFKFSLLALSLVVLLGGCGKKTGDKESSASKIKVGIVGSESEVWEHIREEVKKDGIDLELVFFSDYNQPNRALEEGENDLNSFQHYAFFNKSLEEQGFKLEAIGETVIAPMGIYSDKLENLEEVKQGSKVAIPSDVSNGGRALVLLDTAGLLKIRDTGDLLPSVKDIEENKLGLEIIEMDAALIPNVLGDVALGVINSGIASDAGKLPSEDSIFLEPVDEKSKQYINIIAARKDEKDDERYKKIVKAYQTKEVEDILDKLNKGSQVVVW